MKNFIVTLLAAAALLAAPGAQAQLKALACEPEWGALLGELAGDAVQVSVATTPRQDPHHIEARPSLIARARRADLLVCNGAELEIGWLPLLQRESGNAKIQSGSPGYFAAADHVELIEKPAVVDRAAGDVHAAGNPHLLTDPRNLLPVADALGARLAEIDAANAELYRQRLADFRARWEAAIERWQHRAAPLEGASVAVQHGNWSYLLRWLHMQAVVDLEPKPGLEPSAAHLNHVLETLQKKPALMILRTGYQSARPASWLSRRAQIPAVELPNTVGANAAATDLFALYEDIIDRLLAALP